MSYHLEGVGERRENEIEKMGEEKWESRRRTAIYRPKLSIQGT